VEGQVAIVFVCQGESYAFAFSAEDGVAMQKNIKKACSKALMDRRGVKQRAIDQMPMNRQQRRQLERESRRKDR